MPAWLLRGAFALLVLVVLVLSFYRFQAHRRETLDAATAAPADGEFVLADGLRIHLQRTGPDGGPALLFVHGTGAWSETWRESAEAAAAAGFRAIAVDLPPFGYSQRPAPPDYSRAAQARRLLAVLDALAIGDVILVGHSFGAGATMEAALLAPGRVRGVVLVDAALGLQDGPDGPDPLPVRALLAAGPLRDALVAAFLSNPDRSGWLLEKFIDDPAAATPARVRIYQQPLAVRGSTGAISQWLPQLLLVDRVAASRKPEAYRRFAPPVRLIWGGRDTVTPLAQAQALMALLPDARLDVLPGVGHIPQIEDPAAFRAVLLARLRELHDSTNTPTGTPHGPP